MSYEDGDGLLVRIRIAFGASIADDPATWTWTDVTAWWHVPDEVTIGWGRSSGAEQPERSTLSLTLKNTDGRFTALDPRSPYWPHVRKWTPIEYDIDLGDGAGWRNRFSGFIRRWPLTWPGSSPFIALAKIEAWGVLGRLGRGSPPARSAMRRTIIASEPVAYWPVEDGVQAESAGSALGGGPLITSGTVEFKPVADYTVFTGTVDRYGTQALVDLSAGGIITGLLPSAAIVATSGGEWALSVAYAIYDVPATALSANLVVMEWHTAGGTFARWRLVVTTTSRTQVIAYTTAGAATTVIDHGSATFLFTQSVVTLAQNGGNVDVDIYVANSGDTPMASGSVAGTINGFGITKVACNTTGTTSPGGEMPFGHLAVWATDVKPIRLAPATDSFGSVVREARRSYQREDAVDRLTRLVAEDGLALTLPVAPQVVATPMGWQAPGTPAALYQECEAADGGLLYESGFGLGYLPREARYNPAVALTIDAAAGELGGDFQPVDDDQMLRNYWTVERVEGSSAVSADAESIDQQGQIEASAQLNLYTDEPLPYQAGWRLHLSTVAEPRYPSIGLTLHAHPELAADWCAIRPGSRVQVVNPPEQNVPGVVDQLVVGATETFRSRRSWRVAMNTVPASPWQVAVADGVQRAPADGTVLTADVTDSAASVQITSTADNRRWTTDPAAFPLDIRLGGERVTASGITGTGLTQTVTLSARAVNGVTRAWTAGTPVDVWDRAIAPL